MKALQWEILALGGCFIAALSGCSGSDSSDEPNRGAETLNACETFTACGGELVGTWELVDLCGKESTLQGLADQIELCEAATTSLTAEATGSYRFDAAGQLRTTASLELDVDTAIPKSCFAVDATCADAEQALSKLGGSKEASCTANANGCACKQKLVVPVATEDSYEVSGTSYIETDPSDGEKTTSQYCVQGDVLRVRDDDGSYALRRSKP